MEDYQQRVVEEKTELDEKADRLKKFIANPEKPLLSGEENTRLGAQLVAMGVYSDILGERIAAFA